MTFNSFTSPDLHSPALVWASLAIQSAARERVSLLEESWRRSTRSLIPAAEDKACSSSGIILARTTTCQKLSQFFIRNNPRKDNHLSDIKPIFFISHFYTRTIQYNTNILIANSHSSKVAFRILKMYHKLYII